MADDYEEEEFSDEESSSSEDDKIDLKEVVGEDIPSDVEDDEEDSSDFDDGFGFESSDEDSEDEVKQRSPVKGPSALPPTYNPNRKTLRRPKIVYPKNPDGTLMVRSKQNTPLAPPQVSGSTNFSRNVGPPKIRVIRNPSVKAGKEAIIKQRRITTASETIENILNKG